MILPLIRPRSRLALCRKRTLYQIMCRSHSAQISLIWRKLSPPLSRNEGSTGPQLHTIRLAEKGKANPDSDTSAPSVGPYPTFPIGRP